MVVQIVRLTCRRLNSRTGADLQALVSQAWIAGATTVWLDFAEVVHIDSLGIGALVGAYKQRPEKGRLVLCSVSTRIRGVLNLTRLSRIFEFREEADAALKDTAEENVR
jgi:anti-anti-sigma factor